MTTKFYCASALFVGLIAAGTANAAPINPFNDRSPPVSVGGTTDSAGNCAPAPDCELQSLLDYMPGTYGNAETDQQSAGMWQLAGLLPTTAPVFTFEVTANAASQELGIWSDLNNNTDMADRNLVDIFLGPATGVNNGGGTVATLVFSGGNLTISQSSGDAGAVNEGTFTGISPNKFGFYLQPGGDSGDTFYSLDQLNGGTPQMLAFRDTDANRWALGFEDQVYDSSGSDNDFQDALFTIESIVPVPLPGVLGLFGLGLLGLGFRASSRVNPAPVFNRPSRRNV